MTNINTKKNNTKNVLLYIRVNNDDQAIHGYSLQSQEKKLKRYCQQKGYNVLTVFSDECSVKNGFDRPGYNKLNEFIKENKNNIDYLLFTQWSRFSRDMGASLAEIKRLSKMKIEANAIEQWVDRSIPENCYMLSFYLVAPQI